MRRFPGNRGHTGNWRDVLSGKCTPHASLRKFGGQVDDWRRVGDGEETRSMIRTLKALVEEFDIERVEVKGWVITFRDTSKVGARNSRKSSGENTNSVSKRLFLNRKKEMVERLENEQREAERWTGRFAEAGRRSNASGKWVPPSKNTNLRKQVKSWKRYNERLGKEWRDPQEETKLEPKLVDVIAEVDETIRQELKRDKEEDKKIEDDDVMKGFMEAKKVEDRRAVSDDEGEAAKDRRVVPEAKTAEDLRDVSDSEEEEHVEKKVPVQVVATGDITQNRLREWRNEAQILKDKAARKKNDEMQEAWRKKNDDFMKKCENKKNKKKTRRLKMRLHDKTIKGMLSQTLF